MYKQPYLDSLRQRRDSTYQNLSATLEGYKIKDQRICWDNDINEIRLSLVSPALKFDFNSSEWSNSLCRGLAKYVAYRNGLNYDKTEITPSDLKGYYNDVFIQKYPQNIPLFLAPDFLNNKQRADVIDRLHIAGCELLEYIATDTFQQLKPALNESRIPLACRRSRVMEAFAHSVVQQAFVSDTKPRPTTRIICLTDEQEKKYKRYVTEKPIPLNDEGSDYI